MHVASSLREFLMRAYTRWKRPARALSSLFPTRAIPRGTIFKKFPSLSPYVRKTPRAQLKSSDLLIRVRYSQDTGKPSGSATACGDRGHGSYVYVDRSLPHSIVESKYVDKPTLHPPWAKHPSPSSFSSSSQPPYPLLALAPVQPPHQPPP